MRFAIISRELKAQNAASIDRHARRFRGVPRARRPEGARGALRARHQTRRIRNAEQGQILGSLCGDVPGPSRSGRQTGFRTCSPRLSPRPTRPNCAPWSRRDALRSPAIPANRALPSVATANPSAVGSPEPRPLTAAGRMRLIVVEDDDIVADAIARGLSRREFLGASRGERRSRARGARGRGVRARGHRRRAAGSGRT